MNHFSIGIDPQSNINTPSKVNFNREVISSFDQLKKTILESNWTPGLFENNYRNKKNWKSSSIIGLDIDDPVMSTVEAQFIFQDFKHIIATTKSHQKDKHGVVCERFRIILFLEREVTDIVEYENTVTNLINEHGADKSCKNVDRFFFKCTEIISATETGKLVSVEKPVNEKSKLTIAALTSLDKRALSRKTMEFLLNGAKKGEWNRTLYYVSRNLNDSGYSYIEAVEYLNSKQIPGFTELDSNDLKTMKSAYKNEPKIQDENIQDNKKNNLNVILNNLLTAFSGKLLVYQHNTYFWHTSPTIVKKILLDDLRVLIFKELHNQGNTLNYKNIAEIQKTFILYANEYLSIEKLPSSFTSNPNEITFRYVDLKDIKEGPTPTWDFFGNICGENYKALQAFVWLLLHPEFESRQYVLLKGTGSNGKGSFTTWLQNLIGDTATASASPSDPHWVANCIGKRLLLFPEAVQTTFLMSSAFKAITGNDSITITQKFEKAFTAKLDTKFIVSTNVSVDLANRKSEASRCILVEMKDISENEKIPNFAVKLQEETPFFLYQCKNSFEELYDTEKKHIKADMSAFESHATGYEDSFEVLFQKTFKLSTDEKLRTVIFTDAIDATNTRYDKFFKTNFKEWLLRSKPNVKLVKIKGNYYFKGLALKREMSTVLKESEILDA